MTNTNLAHAMGHIDPKLIADAAPNVAQKKPANKTWVKWASLAACLCLIITASVMIIPSFLNNQIENADLITLKGKSVDSSVGNLTLTYYNSTESQCTFTLVKENDQAIYFCFRGFSVLNTYTDENGAELKEVQQYHVITKYDGYDKAAKNHIVLDDKLIITVNGEKIDTLPTDPGTYEITIDYSELYEFLDYVEPTVEVYSFGSFVIDSDFANDFLQ